MGNHIKVRKSDGLVAAIRTSTDSADWKPPELDEFEWIEVSELPDDASTAMYRYEDGAFHLAKRPTTAGAIVAIVRRELAASDWTAVADREPMPEWVAYRRALRELSGDDPATLLAGFPKRPDGTDPVAHLRKNEL